MEKMGKAELRDKCSICFFRASYENRFKITDFSRRRSIFIRGGESKFMTTFAKVSKKTTGVSVKELLPRSRG